MARRLLDAGQPAQALPLLTQAVEAHPSDPTLRNGLAYALAATGDLRGAARQYRTLLESHPDSAPLLANLGILYLKTGELDQAHALLLKAAVRAPDHANTAFSLGELLDRKRLNDQAFHYYRRAAMLFERQIGPNPDSSHCNDLVKLASARMWTGDMAGALDAFDRAIGLRPDHALALARRGLALGKLRRVPEAIASLRRAAEVEPGFAEARRAIAELLASIGDLEGARTEYEATVAIDPDNAVARYFLAALTPGANPDAPPPVYVETLFDDYATRFESHLVDVLQYRAPELLCEAIVRCLAPAAGAWTILDLGCGTGLCGPLVRPWARTLVGVDLSSGMLEKARAKSAYDELLQEDVTAALGRYTGTVDLALSADVFVYLGNLAGVLAAAARALCTGGVVAFTTETLDEAAAEGFALDVSGRYRHQDRYVRETAAAAGLVLVHHEIIVARYQSGQPVHEHVHIFRKR